MTSPDLDPTAWWAPWLRAWGLRAPLSGDVTQAIDTSLIQINAPGSGDPQLERRIVTEVASYGRQLGRILDALDVLIRHDERGELSAEERRALEDVEALHDEIMAEKGRFAGDRVERVVDEIRTLRRDPAALRRLREALERD